MKMIWMLSVCTLALRLFAEDPLYRIDFNTASGEKRQTSSGVFRDPLALMKGSEIVEGHAPVSNKGFCGKLNEFDQYFSLRASSAAEAGGLVSFTLGGWVKISDIQTQGFIFGQGNTGITLNVLENGVPVLTINQRRIAGNRRCMLQRGLWTFLAVSYDGTKQKDNVKFYVVTDIEMQQLDPTAILSFDQGAVKPVSQPFRIGPNWIGWMDNFRLYGSKEGSEGAISSQDILEWIKSADAGPKISIVG